MLPISVLTFSFALWLGLYLINRNIMDTRLGLAGAGLVAYVVGMKPFSRQFERSVK